MQKKSVHFIAELLNSFSRIVEFSLKIYESNLKVEINKATQSKSISSRAVYS